ncbi:MAG: hypothetical protein WAU17_06135, partial [Nitrospirales bacterium]
YQSLSVAFPVAVTISCLCGFFRNFLGRLGWTFFQRNVFPHTRRQALPCSSGLNVWPLYSLWPGE